jgi:hypothetical protein
VIGCERLCGKCEACEPVSVAMHYIERRGTDWARRFAAAVEGQPRAAAINALLDPSVLAELLARALRGSGVDAGAYQHPVRLDVMVWPHPERIEVCVSVCAGLDYSWGLGKARAALARVLATGSADAAIDALEGR